MLLKFNFLFRLLIVFGLLTNVLFAVAKEETKKPDSKKEELQKELEETFIRINDIDEDIEKNGFWIKRYNEHKEYLAIDKAMSEIKWKIKNLKTLSQENFPHEEIKKLQIELSTLESKLALIGELGQKPYDELIKIEEPKEVPEVSSPFSIITAFSYISDLAKQKSTYNKNLASLEEILKKLEQKKELLENGYRLSLAISKKEDPNIKNSIYETEKIISALAPVYDIYKTSVSVYGKRSDEIEAGLKAKISQETLKGVKILIFLGVIFILMFLLKIVAKKTVQNTDRVFNINRVINIVGFVIVIFMLTFNYISNLTYFVTVLGFVSAGIAIAMKDWFMNILGWLVIVVGGYIHVGDRIRIAKEGEEYVGDVLEITLSRVTLYEDVTLATVEKNRRAGRVIMFPNNFIFSSIVLNYTFSGLKTVWDGIDVVITFDSNHKKAVHLAKEISKRYSKGYTDMTRKELNELRGNFHVRNFSVEPRIFTFVDKYGIKVSVWYLTNSYATLTLRSSISAEIIDAFNEQEDITIAYPSQVIYNASLPRKNISDVLPQVGGV